MSNKLKHQLKQLRKQQEKYQEAVALQQATCPHISKKGNSWLVPFTDVDKVEKGRCKKCGAVIYIDQHLLGGDSLKMSTNVVKSVLAEIRAANREGKIELNDSEMDLITRFDAQILSELPKTIESLTQASKKKKKDKGKKKDKKKKAYREYTRKKW